MSLEDRYSVNKTGPRIGILEQVELKELIVECETKGIRRKLLQALELLEGEERIMLSVCKPWDKLKAAQYP